MTRDLEVVGLNFDRNIEGLSRDFIYLPERGRNIMVDVRAIRAALGQVYHADRILQELDAASGTGGRRTGRRADGQPGRRGARPCALLGEPRRPAEGASTASRGPVIPRPERSEGRGIRHGSRAGSTKEPPSTSTRHSPPRLPRPSPPCRPDDRAAHWGPP